MLSILLLFHVKRTQIWVCLDLLGTLPLYIYVFIYYAVGISCGWRAFSHRCTVFECRDEIFGRPLKRNYFAHHIALNKLERIISTEPPLPANYKTFHHFDISASSSSDNLFIVIRIVNQLTKIFVLVLLPTRI